MINDFNDNDDDLFSESSTTASFSSNAAVNNDIDSFIEQTKEYIDSKGANATQFVIRTGIITTFYELSNNFIFNVETLNRSIISYFNRITDNKFEKELFADVLEESIIKRFAVHQFIDSFISRESIDNILVNSSKLNFQINESYLKAYFGSMNRIMIHAIDRNIDIYQKLCVQIDRVPMQAIIEKDYSSIDSSLFSNKNYLVNSFNSLKESLGFKTY